MGKNPAFQFYPSDWTRDLDDQSLEVEGAWIRICCCLWWSETKGKATKSLQEWSRILRVHPTKGGLLLKLLLRKNIADGVYLDKQNVTIISRRMVRDNAISQIRQQVGKLGGNPNLKKNDSILDNQTFNQNLTPSSSSSNYKDIYMSWFDIFWETYPKRNGKKVGKQECIVFCKNFENGDRELIIQAALNYSKSDEAKKGFARDPIRFLKKDWWKDWTEFKPKTDSEFI